MSIDQSIIKIMSTYYSAGNSLPADFVKNFLTIDFINKNIVTTNDISINKNLENFNVYQLFMILSETNAWENIQDPTTYLLNLSKYLPDDPSIIFNNNNIISKIPFNSLWAVFSYIYENNVNDEILVKLLYHPDIEPFIAIKITKLKNTLIKDSDYDYMCQYATNIEKIVESVEEYDVNSKKVINWKEISKNKNLSQLFIQKHFMNFNFEILQDNYKNLSIKEGIKNKQTEMMNNLVNFKPVANNLSQNNILQQLGQMLVNLTTTQNNVSSDIFDKTSNLKEKDTPVSPQINVVPKKVTIIDELKKEQELIRQQLTANQSTAI
jgi:hypothetical protein